MDILKRIFIISLCSVLLVCATPSFSFRSEAAEVALTAEFLQMAIGYLSGYLVSKGYSIARRSNFDFDDALKASFPDQYQFYRTFMGALDVYDAAHRKSLENALQRAYNSGVFSISEDLDSALTSYLNSQTVNGSLVLGQASQRFEPWEAGTPFTYSYTYYETNDPTEYTFTFTYTPDFDYLPVFNVIYNGSFVSELIFLFIPVTAVLDNTTLPTVSTVTNHPNNRKPSSGGGSITSVSSGNRYIRCRAVDYTFNWNNYIPGIISAPEILTASTTNINDFYPVAASLRANGYFDAEEAFTSTQIVDTSDKDILSSSSEVDPVTGNVSGGFTMYMPDFSKFAEVLTQFSAGLLSYQAAMKALGLSQVSVSATPAEKEAALDGVAFPDSTYDWLTSTAWGSSLTKPVSDEVVTTHDEELALSEDAASTLNNGNEPSDEDKEKAGKAAVYGSLLMWLGLWKTPSFDPDSDIIPGVPGDGSGSDPSKPNYLGETFSGMAVAGSLIDDLWDSVGGSSGLGIVYTIAASFVIFSVLIGAANYFGAMGSNIKSSNKEKISKPSRKGS